MSEVLLQDARRARELGNLPEAVRLYAQILRQGNALLAAARFRDAVESYDAYLSADPSSAEAWHNRGVALSELKHFEEAIVSFGKALALRPDSANSWANRANAAFALQRFADAVPDYERALALNPRFPHARGHMLLSKLQCCDWRGADQERAKISAALRAGEPAIVPFGQVMISDSPAEQAQCASLWIRRHAAVPPLWRGERYCHDRIRVAYVSGDFRVHPVSILMAGVFERHDRTRFETFGISFGPDDSSDIRARIAAGFDRFVDIRGRSNEEIASALREWEIDIAIDLMGLTADCRSAIFAHRPAPVQVNYLGFPGTMGAGFMDYIIADRIVIPDGDARYFRESIVRLPGTFLANDDKRIISSRGWLRSEAGLPEQGFVFCSFNNAYKFMPEMFARWMRLLAAVEGSVLWLPEANAAARANLKSEAERHGVATDRIVFAPFLEAGADHLARLGLADLFLDTLPCNAHSTASDALWAGVPVLTCEGSTFAGRVGASLLNAVGLPELITHNVADYEALAVSLARDKTAMAQLKAKLTRNRTMAPLFDTARFTRNLEAAYTEMHRRASQRETPQDFAVEPQ